MAERVPEIPRWWFAFQSQGASGGPWIGPTVEETLDSLAAEGVKTLLLQPIGFLCDHVEILYDVDIHFRGYAAKLGIRLERPESLNASPTLACAVADLARQGLAASAGMILIPASAITSGRPATYPQPKSLEFCVLRVAEWIS